MKKLFSLLLVLTLALGLALPARADYQLYASDTLSTWCQTFTTYLLAYADVSEDPVDVLTSTGGIIYDEASFNYSEDGVLVVSGGAYSTNNTMTLGIGTGMDENEDYWYASILYNAEASDSTIIYSGVAFMQACSALGLNLGGEETYLDNAFMLLDILFSSEDIAVEKDGMVLVHKIFEGGSELLAVDSLAYYNGFYYNDTENYIVLD